MCHNSWFWKYKVTWALRIVCKRKWFLNDQLVIGLKNKWQIENQLWSQNLKINFVACKSETLGYQITICYQLHLIWSFALRIIVFPIMSSCYCLVLFVSLSVIICITVSSHCHLQLFDQRFCKCNFTAAWSFYSCLIKDFVSFYSYCTAVWSKVLCHFTAVRSLYSCLIKDFVCVILQPLDHYTADFV